MCFLLNLGTLCWQLSSSPTLSHQPPAHFSMFFLLPQKLGPATQPGTLPVKLAATGQSSQVSTTFRSSYHNIQRKEAFLC